MKGQKMELTVKMANVHEYRRPAFGYGYETAYIYSMTTEDGTAYVWKTTALMGKEVPDENGWIIKKNGTFAFLLVRKGDVLKITASPKGKSEYNGVEQNLLERVKVVEILERGKTPEEIEAEKEAEKEAKKQAQLDTLKEGDWIWERMPYKQYKEHYNDCETVIESFSRENGRSYIDVIIREGRLKPSGTRGKRYHCFVFENEKGEKVSFWAITEENAEKRARKELQGEWKLKTYC